MREGWSPTGGGWLQTMSATGRRTVPPPALLSAGRSQRPTTSFIQAPLRFSAGRE